MSPGKKNLQKDFNSNFVTRGVERHLSNPKNKAPAATYIQNKKKRNQRLKDLMDQM